MGKSDARKIPAKQVVRLTLVVAALAFGALAHQQSGTIHDERARVTEDGVAGTIAQRDDAGARAAFLAAYPVLMHPRCLNCHPKGDIPFQGDDSRLHIGNVKRGPGGRGLYAMKCSNCHQATNLPGLNMPPGNPNWHLPPPEMPMVFEGRTPGQLCRQLKDPRQNGRKTLDEIIHHVTADSLVLWGWDPGDGRTKPPLSHPEFAQKMQEWAKKGAACPD